jgi:hypothetical protein
MYRRRFPFALKLERSVTEFETDIRKNPKCIPNFGDRSPQGDTISTAWVESTSHQGVRKRLEKSQQMRWSQRGVHLLLKIRTQVLNKELRSRLQ